MNPNSSFLVRRRWHLTVVAASLSLVAGACGGSDATGSQVASLGTLATDSSTDGAATGDTLSAADTQEAVLAYAACMRDNGIDMADPTFDADGNMQGGLGFGPDSGIDPRSDTFQTAQEACGDLIDGIALGGPGGGRGDFDPDAMQAALTDFTACLRDQGLAVDDITFGPGGGPGGGDDDGLAPAGTGAVPGGGSDGAVPGGATDGSVPGGFQGGPPADGSFPADGEGFDPTSRMIEQLGLDESDPAVTAALDACQPALEAAMQPSTTEAGS